MPGGTASTAPHTGRRITAHSITTDAGRSARNRRYGRVVPIYRLSVEFVYPIFKRNRGWPCPGASWGLDSLFGPDGWCHGCGIPYGPQSGALVLRRANLTVSGVWMPNWRFDTICLDEALAARVSEKFQLDVRDVEWPRSGPVAKQVVFPTVEPAWFDPKDLEARVTARHGRPGASCSVCGRWRWLPLPWNLLPPVMPSPAWDGLDAIASPEWFGDGKQSFRLILLREPLANELAAASPRDLRVQKVQ